MLHEKFRHLVDVICGYALDIFGLFVVGFLAEWVRRLRKKAKLNSFMEEEVMEKEVLKGAEHDVDLVIAEGKVKVKAVYLGKGGGADLEVFVSTDYLLDKIAEKIPGKIDDAILAIAKEALKKV